MHPAVNRTAKAIVGSIPTCAAKEISALPECNVSPVDGLLWKQEAGGAKPPTLTNQHLTARWSSGMMPVSKTVRRRFESFAGRHAVVAQM